MSEQYTKTALVGVGYWGVKLLRNLLGLVGPHGVVVVEEDPARRAAVEREHPHVRNVGRLADALTDDKGRQGVVATPARSHEAVPTAALEAGRHVLVEKPLADSTEAARRLVRL